MVQVHHSLWTTQTILITKRASGSHVEALLWARSCEKLLLTLLDALPLLLHFLLILLPLSLILLVLLLVWMIWKYTATAQFGKHTS